MTGLPEVWLRGPLHEYPLLLMPVAHALLQSREDIEQLAVSVPGEDVWRTPGGAASVGFHILHAGGSIDRLCTYARGESLKASQLRALAAETGEDQSGRSLADIATATIATLDCALAQVSATPIETLTQARSVGRAGLPSTVIGLLVHVAEHTTRHVGQAITTARILRACP